MSRSLRVARRPPVKTRCDLACQSRKDSKEHPAKASGRRDSAKVSQLTSFALGSLARRQSFPGP